MQRLATDGYTLTQGTGSELHDRSSDLVDTDAGLAELGVTPTEPAAHQALLPGSMLYGTDARAPALAW